MNDFMASYKKINIMLLQIKNFKTKIVAEE